jgi:hypothetical protein
MEERSVCDDATFVNIPPAVRIAFSQRIFPRDLLKLTPANRAESSGRGSGSRESVGSEVTFGQSALLHNRSTNTSLKSTQIVAHMVISPMEVVMVPDSGSFSKPTGQGGPKDNFAGAAGEKISGDGGLKMWRWHWMRP